MITDKGMSPDREAELLAEIDLLRRQLAANSGAHRMALADSRQEAAEAWDVAAVKQAEMASIAELNAALRASENHLRLVLESATDFAIMTTGSDGRFTGWNAGARNILGWSEAEITGRPAQLIWLPEDVASGVPEAEMHRARDSGRAADERWHVRRDGTRFWASGEMMPMRDDHGAVVGYLKILRDRTEQHQAEQALRTAERRLKVTHDNLPLGIQEIDAAGRYITVNDRFTAISGWTPADMVGRSVAEFIEDPEDRRQAAARFDALVRGQTEPYVERRLSTAKSGRRWWSEIRTSAVHDEEGGFLHAVRTVEDVTERKRVEDEERRLVGLIEQSTDFIAESENDGRVTFVNPAGRKLVGLPDLAAVRGTNIIDYFAPGDRATVRDVVLPAVRQHGYWEGQLHFRDFATGATLPVLYNVFPLRDAQGAVTGYGTVTRDLREFRKAGLRRAALLDLNDRLRDMEQPLDMAFAAGEILGRALEASAAGYAGIEADGDTVVVERDWTLPGFPSVAGRHRLSDYGSFLEALHRGETVAIDDVARDTRTRDRVGRFDTVRARSVVNLPLVEQGRLVAIFFVLDAEPRTWTPEKLAFVRNVAERTRAEIERRRAEHSLREFAASLEQQVEQRTRERDRLWHLSHDPFLIMDGQGSWLSVNPAWTEILGWSEADLLGRTGEWMMHPDDRARSREEMKALAAGGTRLGFENRFRARDGHYRWFSWAAVPAEGLVFCVARDVTAEKALAEERAQLEEQLRQSQKMEAVGQLTGGVAHDFNNLLTIIRSSVDLLRRPDLSGERRRRYIDAVSDTVDRAAKLTGQLLAFARRQTLKPEAFEVGARLRSIADMLDTVTGARIQVETRLPDEPCFIRADLSQFETALINMAVNARDAMGGEGVLTLGLSCGAAMPPIRGHAGAAGPFAAVSLTDSGSGIPPDHLAHIFEPFFTTKEIGKGTGLGLSQVFGFTKQSGGDVAVESEAGKGTTFTLYLPEVEMKTVEPAEREREPVAPGGAGRRVLVVEDNIEVGRFSTQILQDLGYETTWAANAEEALDKLGQDGGGFDVVFSDVVMPGMGGIELAKDLQRRLPGLPVVLASGYSHVLAEEGAHGFELLQKPYSAEQLSRILRRVARQGRGRPPRAGEGRPGPV